MKKMLLAASLAALCVGFVGCQEECAEGDTACQEQQNNKSEGIAVYPHIKAVYEMLPATIDEASCSESAAKIADYTDTNSEAMETALKTWNTDIVSIKGVAQATMAVLYLNTTSDKLRQCSELGVASAGTALTGGSFSSP